MRTQTDVSGEWTRPDDDEPPGLRIVETPAQGMVGVRIPIDAAVLLGREPGPKGLTLLDPRVSGVHLTVYPAEDGTLHFRDLGSKNGTFHNGQRAQGGQLVEGDVLRLGATLLVVTRRGPAVDHEAEAHDFIGHAPLFREACKRAAHGATTALPILLQGETGSGKEGFARLVHRLSGRTGPFIAVNCATLGGEMANAALFGHERGAFTGAQGARKGLLRESSGGTLFLDEIGDLPAQIQPRLLRALEQHEITPLGASRPETVDLRIVAATHRDLAEDVRAGTFRGDLYARLAGWPITVPALRERREDVLRLARTFLGRPPAKVPYGDAMFDADLGEVLVLYDWPFNVRELKQVVGWFDSGEASAPYTLDLLPRKIVDRAVVPAKPPAPLIGTETAPLKVARPRRRRHRPSREELVRVLEEHAYNISRVARVFDRDRKQIYRWVEHYDIELTE